MALRFQLVKLVKPKYLRTSAVAPAPRRVLDIGIANDSYRELKAIFPDAAYDGIDHVDPGFAMNPGDRFFLRDLDSDNGLGDLQPVYDLILVNHVLEHLARGQQVFSGLCALLAPGGVMYVEVPSIRTAYRRKSRNSYHFHDDPSHKAFYRLEDLANAAIASGCKVVSCGPISTLLKDALALPRALLGWTRGQGYGPFLLHTRRAIDHIMVSRPRQ